MVAMATRAAALDSRLRVKSAILEPAHFIEGHLKNVSDWLEKNSCGSKDTLPPIGLELLGLRVEV